MGQHRTRQQKERTEQRRLMQTGHFSLESLGGKTVPVVPVQKKAGLFEKEYAQYFKQDMMKTVFASIVILAIIGAMVWRLG
jgi:hypothetical protein